jgi:hypothetical protein
MIKRDSISLKDGISAGALKSALQYIILVKSKKSRNQPALGIFINEKV